MGIKTKTIRNGQRDSVKILIKMKVTNKQIQDGYLALAILSVFVLIFIPLTLINSIHPIF